jgi:hypothetical protein
LPFSTWQLQAGWAHFFFFSSAMVHASFGSTVFSWATEILAAVFSLGGTSYARGCRVSITARQRGELKKKGHAMMASGESSLC